MIPGADDATVKANGVETRPLLVTVTVAAPVGVAAGIWRLICPGLTHWIGDWTPFTATVTPARVVDNGTLEADAVEDARSDPKILAIEPGARGGAEKSPPFTMFVIVGSGTEGVV